MALIPILDAAGNIIRDSGGIPIYVYYEGPHSSRVVEVPPDDRMADVEPED